MSLFIETKRLLINTPEAADFDNLFILQSNPDVMKYIGEGVRTKPEVADSLQKAIDQQNKHGFSVGSVIEKSNGQFIGRAGLLYLAFDDTQPDIEVGYALLPQYWQKGYATELTTALIKWGFENLSVNHLLAVIKPKNAASRRVAEKAGLKYIKPSMYRNHEVVLYRVDKPDQISI